MYRATLAPDWIPHQCHHQKSLSSARASPRAGLDGSPERECRLSQCRTSRQRKIFAVQNSMMWILPGPVHFRATAKYPAVLHIPLLKKNSRHGKQRRKGLLIYITHFSTISRTTCTSATFLEDIMSRLNKENEQISTNLCNEN